GRMFAGETRIADIGFPEKAVSPEKVKTFLIEREDILSFLPRRMPYHYKGDCGRVLIIGGSPGMTGAAALAANACLRSGAGMTLLGIPKNLNNILEQKLSETMTLPLPETEDGSISLEAESKIIDAMLWADVLAIGPGISRDDETMELTLRLIENAELPTIIDADALFALSKKPNILKKRKFETIITPHAGEFIRLIKKADADELEINRVEIVRKYSRLFQTTLLLKGSPTLTCGSSGEVFINPTGNAGMATAGSGDVLTGIIAGLAAQRVNLAETAVTSAFMHGLAGDLAADELGESGMIAGDIVDFLPYAFEDIHGRYLNPEE
ncbi:NAD(P)H-hydrate dehydratase, partial [candidate division KSB1 bacterium]